MRGGFYHHSVRAVKITCEGLRYITLRLVFHSGERPVLIDSDDVARVPELQYNLLSPKASAKVGHHYAGGPRSICILKGKL